MKNVGYKKNLFLFSVRCLIGICFLMLSIFYLKWFSADCHMRKAVFASSNENWSKALSEYKSVIRLKPQYILAHYFMGNSYKDRSRDLGDLLKALDKYEQVIDISPYYLKVYYQKAVVLLRLGNLKEAEEAFNFSNRLDDTFYLNYIGLGNIYFIQEKYRKSLKNYKRALNIRPDCWQNYFKVSESYLALGQKKKADEYFRKAIKLNREVRKTKYLSQEFFRNK